MNSLRRAIASFLIKIHATLVLDRGGEATSGSRSGSARGKRASSNNNLLIINLRSWIAVRRLENHAPLIRSIFADDFSVSCVSSPSRSHSLSRSQRPRWYLRQRTLNPCFDCTRGIVYHESSVARSRMLTTCLSLLSPDAWPSSMMARCQATMIAHATTSSVSSVPPWLEKRTTLFHIDTHHHSAREEMRHRD